MFYYNDFIKPLSNGHLHELNKIYELDPGAAQSLIRANKFFAFREAAARGHLHVIERLIELLPENEIPNMIDADNFAAFISAAENGDVQVIERLIELLPKNKIPNMIRSWDFKVFYSAAIYDRLDVTERLMTLLPKNEIPNMIRSWNFTVFHSAARKGSLDVVERLIEHLPKNEIPNMIRSNDFAVFHSAAKYGRLDVIERLMTLLPKNEIPIMMSAYNLSRFRLAAVMGHLHVIERIIELLPQNEIPNMIRSNDFAAFRYAAANGHLHVIERLIELLPENEIPNMIRSNDFAAFHLAAERGRLHVIERLIELLPQNEISSMIRSNDFAAFGKAARWGYLHVIERLIELLPENEIPNMIRANKFFAFRDAASMGHLHIIERLIELLPENEIPNMIRANKFFAFRDAAAKGHLHIIERLIELLPENEIPYMLCANNFVAFISAAEMGHLNILERLIRLLPENEILNMLREVDRFEYVIQPKNNHLYIWERLMTFPIVFDHAERQGPLKVRLKEFINLTLIFLRIEIEAHHTQNPTVGFDVLDTDKAQFYSYMLRNLVCQNKSENFEAVALLLQIPSVHRLAAENNFYLSKQGYFYKQLSKNKLISFFKSLPTSINSLIIDGNKYTPPACYLLNFPESELETLYQDYVVPLDDENNERLTFKAIEPLVPIDNKTFIEMIELFKQHPTPSSDVACALLLEGRIINEISLEKPPLQDTNNSDVLQIIDSFNQVINIGLEISHAILTRNDGEFFFALAQYVENHLTPIMDSETRCRLYALDFLRRAACNADEKIARTIEAIVSHIKATEPVDSPIFEKLSLLYFSQEQGFQESTQRTPSFIIDSNMLPEIDINSLRRLFDCKSGYKYGLFSQAQASVRNEENNPNNGHRSSNH